MLKFMKRPLILTLLIIALAQAATAQVSVKATIDSLQLFIGEQAHVTLTTVAPTGQDVAYPQLKARDTLTADLEVVAVGEETTRELSDGATEHQRTYTITSFEGRLYRIPPFKLTVAGKPYHTATLALKVLEVEVDTAHLEPFPMQGVQDNPFLWDEWAQPFWLSVVAVLLMAFGGYFALLLRSGRRVKLPKLVRIRRKLPHEKAMEAIDQIKADHLTSSEDLKTYYTRLTEAVRRYISERYGFYAMEMTSREIIDNLSRQADAKGVEELTTLFHTADMVKFAKGSALIGENDMNLLTAIDFIAETKVEGQPAVEVVRPEVSREDERAIKTRRTLRVAVIVVAVAAAALVAYVAYTVHTLTV